MRWLVLVLALACSAPPREVEGPRRAPPPARADDPRPIEHAQYTVMLNATDPSRGTIFASSDGGCHVFVRDGGHHPPGWFPPPTPVACPPAMLAVEWGYCVDAGILMATPARDACICEPGTGDPPPPAFRVPCPGL